MAVVTHFWNIFFFLLSPLLSSLSLAPILGLFTVTPFKPSPLPSNLNQPPWPLQELPLGIQLNSNGNYSEFILETNSMPKKKQLQSGWFLFFSIFGLSLWSSLIWSCLIINVLEWKCLWVCDGVRVQECLHMRNVPLHHPITNDPQDHKLTSCFPLHSHYTNHQNMNHENQKIKSASALASSTGHTGPKRFIDFAPKTAMLTRHFAF